LDHPIGARSSPVLWAYRLWVCSEKGQGGGIPISVNTLRITIGGVSEKPGVIKGQIEVGQYLSLTASFDHDIIDGASASRFLQRFKELVERATDHINNRIFSLKE
jgi:hypothetical protein